MLEDFITAVYCIGYLFAFVAISVADGIKPTTNIIHLNCNAIFLKTRHTYLLYRQPL